MKNQHPITTSNLQPFHTTSPLFNNRMNAFYSDTSHSKHSKQIESKLLTLNSLPAKFELLTHQLQVTTLASIAVKTGQKWRDLKNTIIKDHVFHQNLLEISAVLIQKHVRGFLSRLKTEQKILALRELRTDFLIQETQNTSFVCLFNLGNLVEPAAKTIQKGLKNYMKRLKLYRLIRIYYIHMEAKSKEASDSVRKFLLKFACKEKIQSLVFEKKRTLRLAQIKKNLAVLKIKKFWKSRKLNFRILKEKILRLKRKKSALLTKDRFSKISNTRTEKSPIFRSLTVPVGTEFSDDEENENQETLEARLKAQEEQERLEKEKEEALKIFKEKVAISKAAYGLKEKKGKILIPFLQERELSDLAIGSLEVRLFEPTSSSAQKNKLFGRAELPLIRNTQIYTPIKTWAKRSSAQRSCLPPLILSENQNAVFSTKKIIQKETEEFSVNYHQSVCKRHGLEVKRNFQPNPGKKHKYLRKQFLTRGTLAQMLKRQEKHEKEKTKTWKLGRRHSEYVTGLENASFERKKWEPVKLDKSILETVDSTQFASGNIKTHFRVNSDPASIISSTSV